jgi:FKBP-type peptidyl-prolyl cis-trans isomerase SlyD
MSSNPRVFEFHYVLHDTDGDLIDRSEDGSPLAFLEGSGQIIPGLESVLITLAKGEKREVHVKAQDAYGDRDESLVAKVPMEKMPTQEIKIGDMFRSGPGHEDPVMVVTAVTATHVTLDANHPLAGRDLVFKVEIMEVRSATKDEMEHGHAHGPGGHHHH